MLMAVSGTAFFIQNLSSLLYTMDVEADLLLAMLLIKKRKC